MVGLLLILSACSGDATETTEAVSTETETTDVATVNVENTEAPTNDDATTSGQATDEDEAIPTEPETDVETRTGQEIYESLCSNCHGADGEGRRGSALVGIADTIPDKQASIDQIISGGNGMPAFGERLDPRELEAVTDYIYETFTAAS